MYVYGVGGGGDLCQSYDASYFFGGGTFAVKEGVF